MVCIGDPSSHWTSCDPIRTAVACGFTPPPKPQAQKLTKPIHMRRKVSRSSSHCRGANRKPSLSNEERAFLLDQLRMLHWGLGDYSRAIDIHIKRGRLTTREQQTTYSNPPAVTLAVLRAGTAGRSW